MAKNLFKFSAVRSWSELSRDIKSGGQEIQSIEWQELKNQFLSFFVHR